MKKIFPISTALFLSLLGLTACQNEDMTLAKPEKQKMQEQKVDKGIQQGSAVFYQCKDNKQIKAIYTKEKSKKKKTLNKVQITYNEITHKLTLTISESGKDYSNIHWRWQQRDDYSQLTSAVGVILAEQCVQVKTETSTK